ncbi:MAG: phenylalanine--tRNA ligase subunit beta, partial [Frankiales bacterium]|nr:phenylalanine--tRNA ligase subunit beta [Frankiales bacterium]
MRAPVSWLGDHVDLGSASAREVAELLTNVGLKVERVEQIGEEIRNVVVARVLAVEDLEGFKKPVRWVTLTDGAGERQVICGATNFAVGDTVAYARPPATLPGGFRIERRAAYGHESDGMICSARELGLGDDHSGILVIPPGDAPAELGTDVVDVLQLRDAVLDIDVSPDRGYAMSMRGIARDLAIALGRDFRDPATVVIDDPAASGWPVTVDDVAGCDRYVARAVTGLNATTASPVWMQRRLALAGMRPISLAVDVTNHVMLDLGQPLHAFDRTRLRGGIVVRRARAGERLRTLDDVDRVLDPTDLLITDESGPIAIAGVMGGADTEVTDATTDVLLEAAHFDAVSVAYTARRHRLMSEASRRFERGVDDAVAPAAAQVAVDLLVRHGGAVAEDAVTDVDERRERPVITLAVDHPGRLAGVAYPPTAVRQRLTDVGCTVTGDDPLTVTPPSWRPDLRLDVDLVEEVARLEGYDLLPSTVPAAPAGRGLTRAQRQRRVVGRALAGAGLAEVLSYPFTDDTMAEALGLPPDDERRPSVRLVNPVSEQEPFLRASLLPGLLTALSRNVGRGFPDVGLFEIGPVFRWSSTSGERPAMPAPPVGERPPAEVLAAIEAALPAQPLHVALALAGRVEAPGWWGPGRPGEWGDAVELARLVASAVGSPLEVSAAAMPPWHPGRCAALQVDGSVIGHAGELHPRVVEALGLPPRSCAAELRLAPILASAPDVMPAPAISSYPPAVLDVAVVVPVEVAAADVAAALREGAGPLLEDLRLFDVYAG